MPTALVCSAGTMPELAGTVLGRQDVDQRRARTLDEVRKATRDTRFDIAVVDGGMDAVREVVRGLRRYPRQLSIVVIARVGMGASEAELTEAGANAVLTPPPLPHWDDVLARLMAVPPRKHTRVPVFFETQLGHGERAQVGLGTILNLSVRGALIETGHPLRPGDSLDVRFRLPEPAGGVQAAGRVRRLDSAHRFGVEFERIELDCRDRVAGFVADHRTEMIDPVRPRGFSPR
jgi:PilZ domain-containing protein